MFRFASEHARSQERQASAQMRQCSWWLPWRSHSTAQARQAVSQAESMALITSLLEPV